MLCSAPTSFQADWPDSRISHHTGPYAPELQLTSALRVADDPVTSVAGFVCMVQPAARVASAIAMASASSFPVRAMRLLKCTDPLLSAR
jgi:hypothetical protein